MSGAEIERAIAADDWPRAGRLIQTALKRSPKHHWLLARLALTHYKERNYATALRYALRAAEIAPYCPLVLWEVAGAMDMLDQASAALRVYRQLTRKSLNDLAHGPCGEGLAWARGLIADVYFRVGQIHERLGKRRLALRAFEQALSTRAKRASCIYPRTELNAHLRRLRA
jgi:tetratricopeptide (TPR) repeat protein